MALDPKDLRNLDELHKALMAQEIAQNKVYFSEFQEFQPLFMNHGDTPMRRDDLNEMSTKFIGRFNPYKPIEVFNVDGTLMFKVPQLFIPIKEISSEFKHLTNKFHKDGNSDIPKYSSEATHGLLVAIMKSQLDVKADGYKTYAEYINKLRTEYRADVAAFSINRAAATVSNDALPTPSAKTIDSTPVDDLDGISWD